MVNIVVPRCSPTSGLDGAQDPGGILGAAHRYGLAHGPVSPVGSLAQPADRWEYLHENELRARSAVWRVLAGGGQALLVSVQHCHLGDVLQPGKRPRKSQTPLVFDVPPPNLERYSERESERATAWFLC